MRDSRTIEWTLGRRTAGRDSAPTQTPVPKLPRVARLMALAIRIDGLIREGVVRDYADVARLGLVSRARVTQIMNLLNLAPDIQEYLLFLDGRGVSVAERNLRPLTTAVLWEDQRRMWHELNHHHPASS
jgi:hypothetical protein